MKRFVKISGKWIDTEKEMKEKGHYYYIDESSPKSENRVRVHMTETGNDYFMGEIEDQADNVKKVFDLKKYILSMAKIDIKALIISIKLGWPQECEGLTEKEIKAKGCNIHENWMEFKKCEN